MFHIKADGNPGVCKATNGKCPYGANSEPHFKSPEDAREFFEASMVKNHSNGASILLQIADFKKNNDVYEYDPKEYYEMIDSLYIKLEQLTDRDNSENLSSKGIYKLNSFGEKLNDSSYSGKNIQPGRYPATDNSSIATLEKMSKDWIGNLSSDEAITIAEYTGSDSDYLFNKPDSEKFETLQRAILKAPGFERSEVFSGCDGYIKDKIVDLTKDSVKSFSFDQFISTSINPSSINRFAGDSEDGERLGLVIETESGASVISASSSPGELEIILPPGQYEIIDDTSGVIDGEGELRLLRLRFIPDRL